MPFIGGNRKRTHILSRTDARDGKGRVLVVGPDNKLLLAHEAVPFDLSS